MDIDSDKENILNELFEDFNSFGSKLADLFKDTKTVLLKKDKDIESLQSELTEVKNNDNWISVEDRLPKLTGRVLIFYYSEIIDTAWYRPSGKFYLEYNGYARVYENEIKPTHWQPLPNPPEGE